MINYKKYLRILSNTIFTKNKDLGPSILLSKIFNKSYDFIFITRLIQSKKILISDWDKFSQNLNSKLHIESKSYLVEYKSIQNNKIKKIPFKMGGSAGLEICYFLTRFIKPNTIVETGVAMGNSSRAFLTAIKNNKQGHLFSSDLPYLNYKNSHEYIGCVVEEDLKKYWNLFIGEDIANIKKILNSVNNIDLFHYDSDKSYFGRKRIIEAISAKFSDNFILIMDDIGDNNYFMDYVSSNNLNYKIFSVDNKLVGITGKHNILKFL